VYDAQYVITQKRVNFDVKKVTGGHINISCHLLTSVKARYILDVHRMSGLTLWPSVLTGKRNYKNIRKLFGKALHKGNIESKFFITTDDFTPYGWVLKRMLGPACLYGQVVKKRKKNRITKVDRKVIIGSKEQIVYALECSEDSGKMNTSFIERLNLTIRRNTSCLHRKTPAHARRS